MKTPYKPPPNYSIFWIPILGRSWLTCLFRREQAARTSAHKKRLERYEMIGNQWAESGAGKRQHEKDIAEERRVLAEAAIKEKADQDREIVRSFFAGVMFSRRRSWWRWGLLRSCSCASFVTRRSLPCCDWCRCTLEKGQIG